MSNHAQQNKSPQPLSAVKKTVQQTKLEWHIVLEQFFWSIVGVIILSNGTTHRNMTTKDSFPRRLFSLRRSATATIRHHISTDNDRRNNSKKKSIDLPSISLTDTALDGVEIDPVTKRLSVVAAEERINIFRGSLPHSLIAAHDSRDCVAPFRRKEVW